MVLEEKIFEVFTKYWLDGHNSHVIWTPTSTPSPSPFLKDSTCKFDFSQPNGSREESRRWTKTEAAQLTCEPSVWSTEADKRLLYKIEISIYINFVLYDAYVQMSYLKVH